MHVKLPLEHMNIDLGPPYLTNTYTYRVTIVLRVRGGKCTYSFSRDNRLIL